MQSHARTVIVGAGIAGCAMAYHLAALGRRDIVVVDQGPLFHTGGSTSHAPGGLGDIAGAPMMFRFGRDSIDLYAGLATADGPAAVLVGGVETAQTPERWAELKRRAGWARSWGAEATLLSPGECRDAHPLIDPKALLGGLFIPRNGVAWPVRAAQAMAAGAADAADAAAVVFHGETRVIGILVRNGRVCAVITDKGQVEAEEVVLCAGIWGPRIGRMAGVDIPLQPMQHQYAVFEPIAELAGRRDEVSLPILRARDQDVYVRTHFDRLGVGNYDHVPRPVDPEALEDWSPDNAEPSRLPFIEADFENARRAIAAQLPCLDGLALSDRFNGMFSFTPDGMPLLGEAAAVKGFWVAEALWISHAGGAAKALAEWMASGSPPYDLRTADLNRFPGYARRRGHLRVRGAESYINVHAILHPSEPARRPRDLRRSPFHAQFAAEDAVFFDNGGWERPQWCGANAALAMPDERFTRAGWDAMHWSPIQGAEHRRTREKAALFDLSSFTILEITGAGAAAYLNRVCTNEMDVPVGRVVYSAVADAYGGVVADLTVTRLAWDRYRAVTGAAAGPYHRHWLRGHIDAGERVALTDVTRQWCVLGLWGPRAPDILRAIAAEPAAPDDCPYLSGRAMTLGAVPVWAQRLSYVGEAGWELYTPPDFAARLWHLLWAAGRPHGLIAAGAGAMDSLRLEKGYRRFGADLDRDHTVLEAGLGFTVRFGKADFVGRDALLRARDAGPRRRLACLALADPRRVAFGGEPVLADGHAAGNGRATGGRAVGYVTSGNTGYSVGRSLAFAYLDPGQAAPGTELTVESFAEPLAATVIEDPAFDPAGARLRA